MNIKCFKCNRTPHECGERFFKKKIGNQYQYFCRECMPNRKKIMFFKEELI